jgi:transglutaminase-like putative cysteine protease
MHAWVEVLLPAESENPNSRRFFWYALDPTHDRWVHERYVSVAVGRDYYDIMPNSGSYFGRATNSSPTTAVSSSKAPGRNPFSVDSSTSAPLPSISIRPTEIEGLCDAVRCVYGNR